MNQTQNGQFFDKKSFFRWSLPAVLCILIPLVWGNKYSWGYTISIALALPLTFLWASLLRKKAGDPSTGERLSWMPILIGIFERGIITTLVGFNVPGAGAFMGILIITKASQNWGSLISPNDSKKAKIGFSRNLLGSLMSLSFGILGGLIIYKCTS